MIEKGISIKDYTPFKGRGQRMSSYPFMEMEVGDSVFFPGPCRTAENKAYQAAKKYAARSGDRKFSGRPDKDGIRIWRIS